MAIKLKEYQEKNVEELLEKSLNLLKKNNEKKKTCVFKSPTGSGKTIMIAKFIEELIKELPEEDLCFLWVSIGKGNLHVQSKKSLSNIYQGFPKCSLIEEEFFGSRDSIEQNEVVLLNWEKIRNKTKDGEWKNTLMRDREGVNFRDLVYNTQEKRRIICIIDESHYASNTDRTLELRDIIGADLTIEMSATPKITPKDIAEDLANGYAAYITVDPRDVIDSGMIKKEILINPSLDKIVEEEDTSQEVILKAAFEKRIELKKKYEELGLNINPLVLIQLPNSESGDVKREVVELYFAEKGITEKNGKLAVWLSEDKSDHLEDIAKSNNDTEFLLFKQAIDTGWDCPRAQILVRFREIKSEPFEIQTVGRILRMPQQKHYSIDELNKGYIFTNIQSINVKREDYNPNLIKHLKSNRVDRYRNMRLISYYKNRVDYGDITSSFYKILEEVFCKEFSLELGFIGENKKKIKEKGLNLNATSYQEKIIEDTTIDIKDFDLLEGIIEASANTSLKLSINDLHDKFDSIIKSNLDVFAPKRSTPTVRESIYIWFNKYLGIKRYNNGIIVIQSIFMHPKNIDFFTRLLIKAIEKYKPIKKEEIKLKIEKNSEEYEWDISEFELYNQFTHELFKANQNVYEPCYLESNRSSVEQNFEKYLEESKSVDWWYKNGISKKSFFGIKYIENDIPETFYPDFIVKFKDRRIGIFDTKAGITAKVAGPKSDALQKYINLYKKDFNLFGGIVILDKNKKFRVYTKSNYVYDERDYSVWDFLDEIIMD